MGWALGFAPTTAAHVNLTKSTRSKFISSFQSIVSSPKSNTRVLQPRFSFLTMTSADATRRILVPIGNGSEEIETSAAVDTFRRAGAEVTMASVEDSLTVTMSRGMKFVADASIDSVKGPFDAVALPGGMPGAERLRDCKPLIDLLRETKNNGGVTAAVCASPAVVFAEHGLLDGITATCYPNSAFREKVEKLGDGDVVVDGKIITGTGPGTSLKFSLMVVEALYSKDKADEIASQMLVSRD